MAYKFKLWMMLAGAVGVMAQIGSGQEFNLSPTFAGRAVALQETITNLNPVTLADTGTAPSTGGERQSAVNGIAPFPGGIALNLYAITLASGNQSRSQSSLAGLDLAFGGHRVTAQWVEAIATAQSGFLNVPVSGSITVNNLTVDGVPIAITGAANQTIDLPNGYVIINEQTSSGNRGTGKITVNAIHFVVTGVGDAILASATAEVTTAPTR
jgi:hypothetical protein